LVRDDLTGGTVRNAEILEAQREMAQVDGLLACPQGAVTLAGLYHLFRNAWIQPEESIVLLILELI